MTSKFEMPDIVGLNWCHAPTDPYNVWVAEPDKYGCTNFTRTDLVEAIRAQAFREGQERMRERCARAGYVACAETRHVTLGDKVSEAINQLEPEDRA